MATFHSLQAIILSGSDLRIWPKVRKGHKPSHYRSTSYARTNQVAGLQHWIAKESGALLFVGNY